MNKTFVQSMKTIAESVTHNAGFDKTRSGKVVGKNTLTNTYSVRIDGNTYPNVRVVNDATYNVGDTVKVNMPCNQPSQMVIVASIFSDASLGKKIGHAQSLIDAMDAQLEDVKEIDGHIYQLNINSTYTPTSSTHTGQILKDGIDVTSATYYNKFRWYLMKATGKSQITTGISGATLSMQLADYMYGMALVLEWVDNNDGILLRKQIVLFDNAIIEREMRKVENTATQAKSIADNTDQHFWNISSGTDTGFHITEVEKDSFLANPNGYNLLSKSVGVAVRNAADEMAIFTDTGAYFNGYLNGVWQQIAAYTNSYAQIGSTASGQKNLRLDGNGMYLRNGTNNLAEYSITGMTLYNSSKYKTAYAGNDGFKLYDGTANAYEIASFTSSGMVLRNSSNKVILSSSGNSLKLYNGASTNVDVASFSGNGMTLKDANSVTLCTATQSGMTVYQSGVQVASIGSSVVLGKTASSNQNLQIDSTNGMLFKKGNTTYGKIYSDSSNRLVIKQGSSSYTQIDMGSRDISIGTYDSDGYIRAGIDIDGSNYNIDVWGIGYLNGHRLGDLTHSNISIQSTTISVGSVGASGTKGGKADVYMDAGHEEAQYKGRCVVGWNFNGDGSSFLILNNLHVNQSDQEIHYDIRNTRNTASGSNTKLVVYVLCTVNAL